MREKIKNKIQEIWKEFLFRLWMRKWWVLLDLGIVCVAMYFDGKTDSTLVKLFLELLYLAAAGKLFLDILTYTGEPDYSKMDRKTLSDILWELHHPPKDHGGNITAPGIFQQFDAVCDMIDRLEHHPDTLPEVSEMVWGGFDEKERSQYAYAFDGQDDRKDLLNLLRAKRSRLWPQMDALLGEIEEWRHKNGIKSLPPAAEKGRGEALPVEAEGKGTAQKPRKTAAWIKIMSALKSFKIEAKLENTTRGPAVTRYEFLLEPGVKLSKVTSLSADIALALGVPGVRIAPVPGQEGLVGIEVPNASTADVFLRDIMRSQEFKRSDAASFAVGKDINGQIVLGHIDKLPHLLIAGTTGSGKSSFINSLVVSMIGNATPEQIQFLMVDPKKVELAAYNGIPHMSRPVISDPAKAADALDWADEEMRGRYSIFTKCQVKDLTEYNRNNPPMPRIVIIIDELAALMTVAGKQVETAIVSIAQMGRAAGVHLVIATQRPSMEVITGQIKANIPSRVAFAVPSAVDSRIILDASGAEGLLGRGDMLYCPAREPAIRVQGCFIPNDEIRKAVELAKKKKVSANAS